MKPLLSCIEGHQLKKRTKGESGRNLISGRREYRYDHSTTHQNILHFNISMNQVFRVQILQGFSHVKRYF